MRARRAMLAASIRRLSSLVRIVYIVSVKNNSRRLAAHCSSSCLCWLFAKTNIKQGESFFVTTDCGDYTSCVEFRRHGTEFPVCGTSCRFPLYYKTKKACFDSKDFALGREGQGGDLTKAEGGGHDLISAGSDAVVECLGDLSDEPVGAQEEKKTCDTTGRLLPVFRIPF